VKLVRDDPSVLHDDLLVDPPAHLLAVLDPLVRRDEPVGVDIEETHAALVAAVAAVATEARAAAVAHPECRFGFRSRGAAEHAIFIYVVTGLRGVSVVVEVVGCLLLFVEKKGVGWRERKGGLEGNRGENILSTAHS
jgi:hypothetical protein